MPNPIVTTITPLEYITNDTGILKGNTVNNGWETLQWGFWFYKKSAGIGTKTYSASTTTPLGEGDFVKSKVGLLPFTIYVYQARAQYRIWNDELEDYDYVEIFGAWEEFTTHAYLSTLQILACNINKSTGTVVFHGSINGTDSGNCIERGFEYGLTRTPTWKVSEEGNFPLGMFSLNASGLALNTDFYVRTYLKSSSGHYFYTGDGLAGGWRKFTTKVLKYEIAMLSIASWEGGCNAFLHALNENGQEVNSWVLPVGQEVNQVVMDADGYAYYGQKTGTTWYISKRLLSDGSLINTWAISSGTLRGLCIGKDNYLYVLEYRTLYKRSKEDYSEIAKISLVPTSSYACGITLDEDNYIYLGRTTNPDRIEKYEFFKTYDITDVIAGGVGEGSFKIAGDHTSEFTEGISIVIAGSTGNNGTYTISTGGSIFSEEETIIPVDEAVPDSTIDGNITKLGIGEMIAFINSLVDLTYGGLAIIGNYVYAGADFDVPVKADRGLTSIEKWYPSGGNWHSGWWFFYLGVYEGKILIEGATNGDYLRAIAGYDGDENQLWYTELVRGIESINGYPFGPALSNIKAEKRKEIARVRLYGEIL